MKYCKRCLQPDTRPGILFDNRQICYACLFEESKLGIDWDVREEELKKISKAAKDKAKESGNVYDCVIGVSGGKDSTFQAVYAKEKLGLNPLLVNCVPEGLTEIGRHNIDNLSNLGFDIIGIKPNPNIARYLTKQSFYKYGNLVKASEYCLWASAYHIADKFNISLIIQGENAALTLGAALKQEGSGNAYSVVDLNTLKEKLDEWVGDEVSASDLYLYQFPDIERMKKKGIRAIFLQYYAKEWSQVKNADFAIARGLWGREKTDLHDIGRYRRYTALDSDISIVNQMIKYLKFGFGFATDEACYDIREGRLSREDAVWLVKEYDGKCGEQYIQMVCEYLGITMDEFWHVVDGYVNKELFLKDDNGGWKPKFEVGVDFGE